MRFAWKQNWSFDTTDPAERKEIIKDHILDTQGWSSRMIKVEVVRHLGNGVWRFVVSGSKNAITQMKEWVNE